ncbi:hypothetical protein QFC19_008991 [Naganishia cerealis]|uniref:Uncharacterized protein n=1 Tax=Naganishia cerealis TaxID=610337 RepID=A0ACC2UXW3_9TREE|nr:hypothetical protein QFC19_008991 [Naganishia cerealis]
MTVPSNLGVLNSGVLAPDAAAAKKPKRCTSILHDEDENNTVPCHPISKYIASCPLPPLPSNLARWDARAVQNLRENLRGSHGRGASIIHSDDEGVPEHGLLSEQRHGLNAHHASSFGRRVRIEYSPGQDSIISSDGYIQQGGRDVVSSVGMIDISGGEAMCETASLEQRFLATDFDQLMIPRDHYPNDDLISDGEFDGDVYQADKETRDPMPRPFRSLAIWHRARDDHDIIDEETSSGTRDSDFERFGFARETDSEPSERLGGTPARGQPLAQASSVFSIIDSEDDDSVSSLGIDSDDHQQVKRPLMTCSRMSGPSGSYPMHDLANLSVAKKADEQAGTSVGEMTNKYTKRMDENSERTNRASFESVISDMSFMSGIIEDR